MELKCWISSFSALRASKGLFIIYPPLVISFIVELSLTKIISDIILVMISHVYLPTIFTHLVIATLLGLTSMEVRERFFLFTYVTNLHRTIYLYFYCVIFDLLSQVET
jgi:hypothetical protein